MNFMTFQIINMTKSLYNGIHNVTCYFIINLRKKRGNTMAEFNKAKFKAVIHLLIDRCEDKPRFGKTVLFKLLYFSDFDYYELYEEKMTGAVYERLPYGPAPSKTEFDTAIDELAEDGIIFYDRIDFDEESYRFRYLSLKDPSLECLSKDEIKIINNVIDKCSDMSATTITDYSHEDLPWQATEMGETINYELVFYRTPEFSVREYEEEF
jgi:uncharacterized phage-associated protein